MAARDAARGRCVSRWQMSGFVAGLPARRFLCPRGGAGSHRKPVWRGRRGPRSVVQCECELAAWSELVEHERHAARIRSESPRANQRLRRAQRLRSSRDIGRAQRRGRRVGGQFVTLTCVRQAGESAPARVGVVAGKRVGGAVVRNRVKRRLREALRRELPRVAAGWDLVCGARPPAAEVSYAELADELRALLERAGLLAGLVDPAAVGTGGASDQPSPPSPEENRSEQS